MRSLICIIVLMSIAFSAVAQHATPAKHTNKKSVKKKAVAIHPSTPVKKAKQYVSTPSSKVVEFEAIDPHYIWQQPSFRGDLMTFMSATLIYPDSAKAHGIEGKCYLQFVVRKDGAVDSVQIIRSSGDKDLDNEALRVVKLMPPWTPGKKNGAPIDTRFTLPVKFTLD